MTSFAVEPIRSLGFPVEPTRTLCQPRGPFLHCGRPVGPITRLVLGVSPSAAWALPCRAVRAGASAPVADSRGLCCPVALAAVRAVWQPSGASSWVRLRPDHHHSPATCSVAGGGSPEVGALVQGRAPGRRRQDRGHSAVECVSGWLLGWRRTSGCPSCVARVRRRRSCAGRWSASSAPVRPLQAVGDRPSAGAGRRRRASSPRPRRRRVCRLR